MNSRNFHKVLKLFDTSSCNFKCTYKNVLKMIRSGPKDDGQSYLDAAEDGDCSLEGMLFLQGLQCSNQRGFQESL